MNGAEAILRTARGLGAEICLANPGTTELPFVTAFDRVPGIRPVLGLAEAVCTGAADGYSRMTGRPALTLLHLGPGLANGLAYLHNARRAGSQVVNLVGDHSTWHRAVDAPLQSDIKTLAAPMCVWVHETSSADSIPSEASEAVTRSLQGPTCLVIPFDHQSAEVDMTSFRLPPSASRTQVDAHAVEKVATALRTGKGPAALFLGGSALSRRGLEAAKRIEDSTGCSLLQETFPARAERGEGLPDPLKLPYLYEAARGALEEFELIVLAGAREPVSFFGYPGKRSSFVSDSTTVLELAGAPQDTVCDVEDALERLAEQLSAESGHSRRPTGKRPGREAGIPSGPLNPETFAMAVAAAQLENCIVVDESVTSGFGYHAASASSPQHTYVVPHLGGAIGHGLPVATGAALACPDRPVILLEADGSAMYTLQALWTQARESLHVVTVICANRSYRILQMEMGSVSKNDTSQRLLDISDPHLDWTNLAIGMGVDAVQVETAEGLYKALRAAVAEPGPHLIEALID